MYDLRKVKKLLGVNEEESVAKVDVTPEMAKRLLRNCNKANRRLNKEHWMRLKHDMEISHWYNDVDYIAFNKDGVLVNGQHRLKALSESEIDHIALKFDFDAEQHVSMDTGRTRKWNDQVTIASKFGQKLPSDEWRKVVTMGVKLFDKSGLVMTNTGILEVINRNESSIAAAEADGLFDLGKVNSAATKAALLWAYMSGVDKALLKHFADVLRTGITREQTDIPAVRLRDELLGLRGNGNAVNLRRAALTQQTVANTVAGYVTNRLPSNPQMCYGEVQL